MQQKEKVREKEKEILKKSSEIEEKRKNLGLGIGRETDYEKVTPSNTDTTNDVPEFEKMSNDDAINKFREERELFKKESGKKIKENTDTEE